MTIPRIAIRMEGDKIAEVRGIAPDQEIEPAMKMILEKKLKEFPDREEYKNKVYTMQVVTKIYDEYQQRELTKEELKILYEIDTSVFGFGNKQDPRLDEIRRRRNKKKIY